MTAVLQLRRRPAEALASAAIMKCGDVSKSGVAILTRGPIRSSLPKFSKRSKPGHFTPDLSRYGRIACCQDRLPRGLDVCARSLLPWSRVWPRRPRHPPATEHRKLLSGSARLLPRIRPQQHIRSCRCFRRGCPRARSGAAASGQRTTRSRIPSPSCRNGSTQRPQCGPPRCCCHTTTRTDFRGSPRIIAEYIIHMGRIGPPRWRQLLLL